MSGSQQHIKLPKNSATGKKIQLVMNRNSKKQVNSLCKGTVNVVDQKDEVFFETVKPLISGNTFSVEMNSGSHIEQNVYLDIDLQGLHIEQMQKNYSEIINVNQISSTELPQ